MSTLTQISFQYKFPLLLLLFAQEGRCCSLTRSLLTTKQFGFLWDCRSPHAHRLPSTAGTSGCWPKPRVMLLCPFLLSQPEYLRGERQTWSWSTQEPRSSCLVVSQAASPASPSPFLAHAYFINEGLLSLFCNILYKLILTNHS